jgi:hypothetical protein
MEWARSLLVSDFKMTSINRDLFNPNERCTNRQTECNHKIGSILIDKSGNKYWQSSKAHGDGTSDDGNAVDVETVDKRQHQFCRIARQTREGPKSGHKGFQLHRSQFTSIRSPSISADNSGAEMIGPP